MSEKVSTTSERIREAMREQRLKQVDVIRKAEPIAEALGLKIQKGELSSFLSGRYEPSAKKLYVLSLTLQVSEAWLLGYDVPKSIDHSEESLEREKVIDWIKTKASTSDLLEFIAAATDILRSK